MKNVYQMVTDRIIEQLKNGVVPWLKPWKTSEEFAYNRVTKKPYSFLNQMLLQHTGEYASFQQWKKLGGKIKMNEKSEIVVFWKWLKYKEINKETNEEVVKEIPYLKYCNVFHITQVEGVKPLDNKKELITNDDLLPIDKADSIIRDYIERENISFNNTKSDKAFYSPILDKVVVPALNQFDNANEYYSTLFHECIHSTGHKSRLNRLNDNKSSAFGSKTYSKEELVAEIGSSFIMNLLGIETDTSFNNSVSYIDSWLSVLENDNKFIVSASTKAEKAVHYILNDNNDNLVK